MGELVSPSKKRVKSKQQQFQVTLTVLPGKTRRFTVCVMALSAGRLNFPKISLKSPQIADALLQQALRTLPATIFVLVSALRTLENVSGDSEGAGARAEAISGMFAGFRRGWTWYFTPACGNAEMSNKFDFPTVSKTLFKTEIWIFPESISNLVPLIPGSCYTRKNELEFELLVWNSGSGIQGNF